jgi:hypothetical protein
LRKYLRAEPGGTKVSSRASRLLKQQDNSLLDSIQRHAEESVLLRQEIARLEGEKAALLEHIDQGDQVTPKFTCVASTEVHILT